MTSCFNKAIRNPETNLQRFTKGITYLLPKFNETSIPKTIDVSYAHQPCMKF